MPSKRRRLSAFVKILLSLFLVCGLLVAGAYYVLTTFERVDTVEAPEPGCRLDLSDGKYVLEDAQAVSATTVSGVAFSRDLPPEAVTVAYATVWQESAFYNLEYGDRDSLGLFQQRPSQGWGTPEQVMDPLYSTNAFLDGLVTVPGYTELPVTEAAQEVQRSAFPDAYADHEPEGRAFASALTGHSTAALTCRLPMPEEPVDVAAAVTARLARDFGIEARADGDGVVVDPTHLGEDGERLAWAVAHWAVATAQSTGATTVEVAGHVWDRAAGNDAAWERAEAPAGAPVVRIS